MNYKKIKMVIAGLGGRGHDIYSNYGLEHPDEMEVIAIADPRPDRLKNRTGRMGNSRRTLLCNC